LAAALRGQLTPRVAQGVPPSVTLHSCPGAALPFDRPEPAALDPQARCGGWRHEPLCQLR
jgi:hypothetical protein